MKKINIKDINNKNIIWYGPFLCRCLKTVVQAELKRGGIKLDYASSIYPNHIWKEHICSQWPPATLKG